MKSVTVGFRWCFWLAVYFGGASLFAQTGSLRLAALNTSSQPRLMLSGTSNGAKYTFEQSFNLADWFSIYTGTATNGVLQFDDAEVKGRPAFYRARLASASLSVQALVDTNRAGCGLIGTNGGYCEVTAANGTLFRLTVPPGTVSKNVAVTMTVITNLAGVPGDGLFPAAVEFEPDGFEFFGAALLEIHFPTNVPLPIHQIASYAFAKNGGDFYLTPDLVGTGLVQIPITHFSAAGTSQFTKQQLAAFTTLSIENARNQVNQRLASKLAQARQEASADPDVNVAWLIRDDYISELNQFYKDHILPHLNEATKNCALWHSLMATIRGAERQWELLYAANADDTFPDLKSAESTIWCPGLQNCEQEILDQCEREGGNTALLTKLNSLERERQFLSPAEGGGCAPPPDLEARMSNCLPRWLGTFTYTEYGVTNMPPNDGCVQDRTIQFHVDGIVTNSTEWDFGFAKLVTLDLQADASGDDATHISCMSRGDCFPDPGSWSQQGDGLQRTVGANPEPVTVSWTIYPDGSVEDFQILMNEIPASFTLRSDSRDEYCSGATSVTHGFIAAPTSIGAYSYVADPGATTGVTANSASGSFTQPFTDPFAFTKVTWTWDFHRRP